MKKILFMFAALVAALCVMAPAAEAAAKKKKAEVVVTPAAPWIWPWTGPWSVRDPALATTNAIVAGGATGAYFAIRHNGWAAANPAAVAYIGSSVGCAAVSPIVATILLKRQLTLREAHVSTANCFLPFLGGMIVNAAFDAHPEWEAPAKPARR